MSNASLQRAFRRQALGVSIASAALSAFFGWLAAALHNELLASKRHTEPVVAPDLVMVAGTLFGLLAGLLAALIWLYVMRRHTLRLAQRPTNLSAILIATGVGMGLLAGIAATFLLHLGLYALTLRLDRVLDGTALGLIFGVPVGLILGLICGISWWHECANALRKDRQTPPETTP